MPSWPCPCRRPRSQLTGLPALFDAFRVTLLYIGSGASDVTPHFSARSATIKALVGCK
jgi:hypothetical protein